MLSPNLLRRFFLQRAESKAFSSEETFQNKHLPRDCHCLRLSIFRGLHRTSLLTAGTRGMSRHHTFEGIAHIRLKLSDAVVCKTYLARGASTNCGTPTSHAHPDNVALSLQNTLTVKYFQSLARLIFKKETSPIYKNHLKMTTFT